MLEYGYGIAWEGSESDRGVLPGTGLTTRDAGALNADGSIAEPFGKVGGEVEIAG